MGRRSSGSSGLVMLETFLGTIWRGRFLFPADALAPKKVTSQSKSDCMYTVQVPGYLPSYWYHGSFALRDSRHTLNFQLSWDAKRNISESPEIWNISVHKA